MLRSLIAIIIATLIGLAAARIIEAAGLSASGPEGAGYSLALLTGWFAGAFIAALLALVIGQRWAPLGGLAAATLTLSAIIGLAGAGQPVVMWPAALLATAAGGFAAIKLLKAPMAPPDANQSKAPFND